MALRYELTDKQVQDMGDGNTRLAYTCTWRDKLDNVVLVDVVDGTVNSESATWADGVAGQIADDIVASQARAEKALAMETKTDGMAERITSIMEAV